MGGVVDVFIAYKFIRLLSTPWHKWDAYKLGLIDKKGKTIKKPETRKEKAAMPMWKTLIRNIKIFLEKLPFGSTRLGSFAAALWLIKEETGMSDVTLLEIEFEKYLVDNDFLIEREPPLICEEVEYISRGKYISLLDDRILWVKNGAMPVGKCFKKNIFELGIIASDNTLFVTEEQIRRI